MKHRRLVLRDYWLLQAQSNIRDFMQIIRQGTYILQPSHATGIRYFPSCHCYRRPLSNRQGKHHFLICKACLPPLHPSPNKVIVEPMPLTLFFLPIALHFCRFEILILKLNVSPSTCGVYHWWSFQLWIPNLANQAHWNAAAEQL